MNPRPLLLAAALLGAAALPTASAQEAPAEKAALRLRPAPGKPVLFVHSLETVQDSEAVGRTTARTDQEFSLEVLRAVEGGGFEATVRFGRGRTYVSNPLIGEKRFDSGTPMPVEKVDRLLSLSAHALAGASFPVGLDAGGRVVRVDGTEEVVAARKEALGLSVLEEVLLKMTVQPAKVADLLNAALVATPLPAEEVAVGRRWEDADVVPGTSQKVKMTVGQILTVARVGRDEVVVEGEGRIELRMAAGPGEEPPAGKPAGEGPATSRLRLSRTDGLPLDAVVKSTLTLEMGGAAVEQSTLAETRRVERWPSEKEAGEAKAREAEGEKR